MNETALTIQGLAVILLPALIQVLRVVAPVVDGQRAFWVNLALNVAVAIAVSMGLDVPIVAAATVGAAGALTGSKVVDIAKHGVDRKLPRSVSRRAA